jgi:hypothetical protein
VNREKITLRIGIAMAKIVDNPAGGRRQIRLSADDVAMVVSAYQLRVQHLNAVKAANYSDLHQALMGNPIYLPEEL